MMSIRSVFNSCRCSMARAMTPAATRVLPKTRLVSHEEAPCGVIGFVEPAESVLGGLLLEVLQSFREPSPLTCKRIQKSF